jgi:hypothetical protein
MTSILPRKKFSCIFVNKSNWSETLLTTIHEKIEEGENILILLQDEDDGTGKIESEIKRKLWIKLGDYKIQIVIIPEVTSILCPTETQIMFK